MKRFKCEIDNIKTLKKGMEITLTIDDKSTLNVMQHIYNFMDKPLIVDFSIDEAEQQARLNRIRPEQRKKIYALFRDISAYTGNSPENEKENLKTLFIQQTHYEPFSLSNCDWRLASDFIEWLIDFCFENGIPLSKNPSEILDDIEKYVRVCLRHKICTICGQAGEIHHWDTIGRGRDRTRMDHWRLRKICLCRKHHTEARQMGVNAFEDKYHVYGIVWRRDDEIHKD